MSDPAALAYDFSGALRPDAVPTDESLLVARARDGDLDAFDAIVMRYEGRLLRFLIGLVGEVEVARELCQDTFLAAYQAMPRQQGEMNLSAWLHTIALNRARSHHRRRRLRSFVSIDDHEPAAETNDMQDVVAGHDAVQRVLAQLPRQYAYPLLLQTVSGLSCREIASVLGCSEGAVKVRLLRARQAFRRIYEEEGGSCDR